MLQPIPAVGGGDAADQFRIDRGGSEIAHQKQGDRGQLVDPSHRTAPSAIGVEGIGNLLDALEALLQESDYTYAVIFDLNLIERFALGKTDVPHGEIVLAMKKALASRQPNTELMGATWGVLWRQKAVLMQSAPLYNDGILTAGVSIVFPLQQIYQQLRHSQMVFFLYILINLILLSFIGRHRFSRLTIDPLKKLLETAVVIPGGQAASFRL